MMNRNLIMKLDKDKLKMNLENYKVLKLSNGEMIVCEINGYNDKMYDIMNPLRMDVVPVIKTRGWNR